MTNAANGPAIVVFSSLFPSPRQPSAGVFVRERMFRVGQHLPLCVVAPVPWFPMQSVLRWLKPHFRPDTPRFETQSGFDVWRPRYLSFPGVLKRFDGLFMALSSFFLLRKLQKSGQLGVLDAHFAYPDGYAATLLGRWLAVPVTITLRGTEYRHANAPQLAPLLTLALNRADHIFAVANSLKQVAVKLGVAPEKIEVVGNGVDTKRFAPQDRSACKAALGIAPNAPVLISVGGLVERKGFHRVIALLPQLIAQFPQLSYLIVGGASAEGNNRAELEAQVADLALQNHVQFLGSRPVGELSALLSAADVFVLSTRNEGWANVFLEAMACGLPVVTTDVGGNKEVVTDERYGAIVPFDDADALLKAVTRALSTTWDRTLVRQYAEQNSWDDRVERLKTAFKKIASL